MPLRRAIDRAHRRMTSRRRSGLRAAHATTRSDPARSRSTAAGSKPTRPSSTRNDCGIDSSLSSISPSVAMTASSTSVSGPALARRTTERTRSGRVRARSSAWNPPREYPTTVHGWSERLDELGQVDRQLFDGVRRGWRVRRCDTASRIRDDLVARVDERIDEAADLPHQRRHPGPTREDYRGSAAEPINGECRRAHTDSLHHGTFTNR